MCCKKFCQFSLIHNIPRLVLAQHSYLFLQAIHYQRLAKNPVPTQYMPTKLNNPLSSFFKNRQKTPLKYLTSPQMSKPIPSKTIQTWKNVSTSHVRSETDLLVWFEICELEASGEYIPVAVDHSDDIPCAGKFLLHQGVQRRIAVTICHEDSSEIAWKDVKEIVIGRVRGHRDHESSYNDQNVLTLNLISAHYTHKARDDQR